MNNVSNMKYLSSKNNMNNPEQPTVVIVPGLRDHVPDHWQTHLAHELPAPAPSHHWNATASAAPLK